MSLLRIVDVRSGSPYELSDLLTQMQFTFSKGKEQLRAIVQQMKLKLSSDCEGENLILLSELPSMKMNRRGGGDVGLNRLAVLPLSYSERAQMRKHCRNVAKVLRVLDLLLRDTLYALVESNLTSLCSLLRSSREEADSSSVLHLYVRFDVASSNRRPLSIAPPKDEVLERMRTQLLETLEMGVSVHSLIKEKVFADVLVPIVEEIPDIISENMLDRIYSDRENTLFQIINAVGESLETDFDAAQRSLDQRGYICGRYADYGQLLTSLSTETVRKMNKEAIEEILQGLNENMRDCQEIPESLKIGVMELIFKGLKTVYLDQLLSFRAHIHGVVQHVYLREGERLYSTLFNYKTTFDDDIPDLDAFIVVLIKYNASTDELPMLSQSYHFILALRDIITRFSIESTDQMTELSNTVSTIWHSYHKTCSLFADALDGNRKFFMRELSSRCLVLTPLVSECKKYASSPILDNPLTDEHEALSELLKAEEVMARILTISATIVEYQNVMKVYVFDYDDMMNLKERIASMVTIWTIFEEAKILRQQILNCPWNSLDVASSEKTCKVFMRTMGKIIRPEVITIVQVYLKEFLHQLLDSLKLFRMLQGVTLLQRHRDVIVATCHLNIFADGDAICVSEVLKSDVAGNIDFITNTYECSVKEANLASQYQLLCKHCEHLVMELISDKQMLSVSNFPRLIETLHDVELEIQIALNSKHSNYSREGYKSLLDNTLQWQLQLRSLVILQQEFLKIRALFTR